MISLGFLNHVSAKTMGVVANTLPSETIFSFELKSNYFFGIPVSVSSGGLAMDADRLINNVKALDGDKNKSIQYNLSSGANSSALEHSVPEQMFSTPDNPAQGISAVKALQLANDQGIPIFTINQTNIAAILPQLQLDEGTISYMQSAVNAGKVVAVSKTDITFNGWTGCGYMIIDPKTGAGAYMISGGMNGAYLMMAIGATEIFIGMFLLGTVLGAGAGIIAIIQGLTIFLGGLALFINNDFSQKEIAYYICMLPNYIGNLLSTLVGGLAEPLLKPALMFAFEYLVHS